MMSSDEDSREKDEESKGPANTTKKRGKPKNGKGKGREKP